jgi:hypothetical protein
MRLGVGLGLALSMACGSESTTTPATAVPVVAPTFSPNGGTFTAVQNVTLATSTAGAAIRYTEDGSTPSSTHGTVYTAAIQVGSTKTLRAIAYKAGMADSAVVSKLFEIQLPGVTSAPVILPVSSTINEATDVTITSTIGAVIYYTTNGDLPTETVGNLYTGAFQIHGMTTAQVRAIAHASGMSVSAETSKTYSIVPVVDTPTFLPDPTGTSYSGSVTVTINSTTGATIHYTTGSTPPTCSSQPQVSAGSTIPALTATSSPVSVTIQAIACMAGMTASAVATSGTYNISVPGQALAPTFSPAAGTYNNDQTVTIRSSTAGAKIAYTTNGGSPVCDPNSSPSSPVNVSIATSQTLKATACSATDTESTVASAAYTLQVAPPTFSPSTATTFSSTQDVVVSTTTSGASIAYTTNGTDPSCANASSSPGSVTATLSATVAIKAVGCKANYDNSGVATSPTYTLAAAAPFVVDNFEGATTPTIMDAYSAGCAATVVAYDQAQLDTGTTKGPGTGGNGTGHIMEIYAKSFQCYLKLAVTLPAGKHLTDYTSLTVKAMFPPTNTNYNTSWYFNSYKNIALWYGNTLGSASVGQWVDTGGQTTSYSPELAHNGLSDQTPGASTAWATYSIALDASAAAAVTAGTFLIGVGVNEGPENGTTGPNVYYVDDITLVP